jgi:hypothetical protein
MMQICPDSTMSWNLDILEFSKGIFYTYDLLYFHISSKFSHFIYIFSLLLQRAAAKCNTPATGVSSGLPAKK